MTANQHVWVVLPQSSDLELGPPLGVFPDMTTVKQRFPGRTWTYCESLRTHEGRRSDGAIVIAHREELQI